MKKHILFMVFACLLACHDNKQQNSIAKPAKIKQNRKEVSEKAEPKTDIHDCTSARDTIFKDGDWIKYVYLKDGGYGVQIKLGKTTDTLDYVFDCREINGLIPKIFKKGNDYLILSRGSGFTYRDILVCDKKNDSIVISEFESNRAHSEAADYFVYKRNDRLYCYDRFNDKEFNQVIPGKYKGLKIIDSEIYEKEIIVHFENGKKLKVAI
ncbi:MAG: hypothetical protein QM710_06940 [Flavobacterium sp.]